MAFEKIKNIFKKWDDTIFMYHMKEKGMTLLFHSITSLTIIFLMKSVLFFNLFLKSLFPFSVIFKSLFFFLFSYSISFIFISFFIINSGLTILLLCLILQNKDNQVDHSKYFSLAKLWNDLCKIEQKLFKNKIIKDINDTNVYYFKKKQAIIIFLEFIVIIILGLFNILFISLIMNSHYLDLSFLPSNVESLKEASLSLYIKATIFIAKGILFEIIESIIAVSIFVFAYIPVGLILLKIDKFIKRKSEQQPELKEENFYE